MSARRFRSGCSFAIVAFVALIASAATAPALPSLGPVAPVPGALACGKHAAPFLIDCGLDAAGELLAWLYPGSSAIAPVANGRLLEFDQTRYLAGLDETGLSATGYVYVPDACTPAGAGCHVHVVFHGCSQAHDPSDGAGGTVGATFVERAGYDRWAAGSRIVVPYPQVKRRARTRPACAASRCPIRPRSSSPAAAGR